MNVSVLRRSVTAVARFMAALLLLLHGPIELTHASHHVRGKLTDQSISLGFITGDDHCPICEMAAQDSTVEAGPSVTLADVKHLHVPQAFSVLVPAFCPPRIGVIDSRGPPAASSLPII